jgi:thiamine biosynthesis lipoprotein ApbE
VLTRSTGDAFAVTVGPLRKRRPGERGGRAVDEALWLVGADKVVLRAPNRVELPEPGMSIDFSPVLRGYVLERMASSLRDGGVTRALLAFEEMTYVAIGPPAAEEPFRIWIPRGKSMAGSIALRDRAAATCRAARRGDDERDPRDAIVDPRSGRFVEGERQATVVARDAAIADAWSAALIVDPDGALVLLDEPRDVEALVFDEHGEHASPRFVEWSGWKPARASGAPRAATGQGAAGEHAGDKP